MGFQCVPQFIALTNGTPRPKKIKTGKGKEPKEIPPRHRANGVNILMEMAEERATASETFDRTRSCENEYWSILGDDMRGKDVWDEMVDECFSTKQKVKKKDGTVHERERRKDTIVGVATIIKAPAEVVQTWSPSQLRKFYEDAEEVLGEIDPELFRPETKRFEAMHADEDGPHFHDARQAVDRDGRYIGARVESRKWLGKVNQNFYKGMQERGWDVARPDYINEDDWKESEEYRAKRRAKWDKGGGRSVNDYRRKRSREMLEKAEQMQSEAVLMYGDAKAALEEIEEMKAQAEIDIKNKKQELIDEKQRLEAERQKVKVQAEAVATDRAAVDEDRKNLNETVDAAIRRRDEAAKTDVKNEQEAKSRSRGEEAAERFEGIG